MTEKLTEKISVIDFIEKCGHTKLEPWQKKLIESLADKNIIRAVMIPCRTPSAARFISAMIEEVNKTKLQHR